jgi:zinc/manganese transport system ATP-binding protein
MKSRVYEQTPSLFTRRHAPLLPGVVPYGTDSPSCEPAGITDLVGGSLMIVLNQLVVGYQHRAVTPPLSGEFARGSMTALVGANGCGKSTLLKTLCGMLPAISGSAHFSLPRPSLAWLPQHSEIEKNFPLTVFDLVAMGFWRRCGWLRGISRSQRQQVMSALERVNMLPFVTAAPGTLSGGQLQRVLFARLLVQEAELLLLDEPFSGVDSDTIELLLQLLAERHQAGCTLIVVLHDMATVAQHFPQVLRLKEQHSEWSCRDCGVTGLSFGRSGGVGA